MEAEDGERSRGSGLVARIAETEGPIPLNDLSRSWIARSSEVRAAVLGVIAGGQYVHGREHTAFEAELGSFLGIGHAIGVASGTDALSLALLGVGCTTGSEVVAAANAGGYTAIAAARLGCGITYADVDRRSLVMTPDTVAAAIEPSTRAVVVTHLYGNVADTQAIVALCRPLGIAVVEDCAQSLGATVDGQRVGSLGDVAALSFYPTKNLGAAGDAGAVVTSDSGIARSVQLLRQYGWSERYVVEREHGMNSRLDEIQAAILRVGLKTLDAMNEKRRRIVLRYEEALHGTPASMVSGSTSPFVAHLAVVRSEFRDRMRHTLEAAGIETTIHYPVPDHFQAGLPNPMRPTDLVETERATREILTVPCFPEMTAQEIDRVCETLRLTAQG